jgi:SAM-dependent methyltransferase
VKNIPSQPVTGRLRLGVRWTIFGLRSVRSRDFDFTINALVSLGRLLVYSIRDAIINRRSVECNLCGWKGNHFYPNTGPGYHELRTVCPGCRCQNRHRSLVTVLRERTAFFEDQVAVLEVAPMMRFQEYTLANKPSGYVSFDIERFAMEKGDITKMRYEDNSQDYFLALHVLEHIPQETEALSEILRVLKPQGTAILQVPIDWSVENTYEYGKPDPREVGHVRRYGQDFAQHIAQHGFEMESVSVSDLLEKEAIERYGLCREPFFFARKSAAEDAVAASSAGEALPGG